jgi:alginate O-acetyltransferase complex protein AlgI
MSFDTIDFIFFLPVALCLFWVLRTQHVFLAKTVLLGLSLFFYGYWNWKFLWLILVSISIDFIAGAKIHQSVKPNTRRCWLIFSLATNFGILFYFKYFEFLKEGLYRSLNNLGIPMSMSFLYGAIPLGLSFYTFQSVSYSIDVYRRKLKPSKSFLDFALYVSFFPQLVAGPIEKASRLLPQFGNMPSPNWLQIRQGCFLLLFGLFKKIVIADNIAILVKVPFAMRSEINAADVVMGVLSFPVLLYADFSAYSDIAKGVAKFFGIDLIWNFNFPLLAKNPVDFWGKWHVSLFNWLQDYVYQPLVSALNFSKNRINLCIAIVLTFVISGLWHGAGLNFLAWGAANGVLFCLYIAIRPLLRKVTPKHPVLNCGFVVSGIAVTFISNGVIGIFFISHRLRRVFEVWDAFWAMQWTVSPEKLYTFLLFFGMMMGIDVVMKFRNDRFLVSKDPILIRFIIYWAVFLGILLFGNPGAGQFIYFQF